MQFDANDNAIAVFGEGVFPGPWDVTARYWDGTAQAWDPLAIELSDPADHGNEGLPDLVIDANNNAICVFNQDDGAGAVPGVFARRYDSSGGWAAASWGGATPTQISTNTVSASPLPEVAVDTSGNAVAVFREGAVPPQVAYSNYYDVTAGTWGAPVRIGTNGGNWQPRIGMDLNGNAIATWDETNAGVSELHAGRRTTGAAGTWTSQVLETAPAGMSIWWPDLSFDPTGARAACVYEMGVGPFGPARLVLNRYDAASNTWAAPELPDNGTWTVRQLDALLGVLNPREAAICILGLYQDINILWLELDAAGVDHVYFNQYH